MIADSFTVEERAARFQRRYGAPALAFLRLDIAGHDLWTHVLWRGVIVPAVRPVIRWLASLKASAA